MSKVKVAASISLYLNLVLSKLAGLAAVRTKLGIGTISSNQRQETQCAIGDDGLCWIANNDDGANGHLAAFLGFLGITSKTALVKHVSEYGSWVLDAHQGKVNTTGGSTSKQKLFAALEVIDNDTTVVSPALVTSPGTATSANKTLNGYTLGSNSTPGGGLRFINGTYTRRNTQSAYHAEQKLMAAIKKKGTRGTYYINGCKLPCTTCNAVYSPYATGIFAARNIEIAYTDTFLDTKRPTVGLPRVTTHNVATVNLTAY